LVNEIKVAENDQRPDMPGFKGKLSSSPPPVAIIAIKPKTETIPKMHQDPFPAGPIYYSQSVAPIYPHLFLYRIDSNVTKII
jgi:hypothetical protein